LETIAPTITILGSWVRPIDVLLFRRLNIVSEPTGESRQNARCRNRSSGDAVESLDLAVVFEPNVWRADQLAAGEVFLREVPRFISSRGVRRLGAAIGSLRSTPATARAPSPGLDE
jgi:hypothetical protein